MQEMKVQTLGREDPLEEEMATHSSILSWETPWTEEHWKHIAVALGLITSLFWIETYFLLTISQYASYKNKGLQCAKVPGHPLFIWYFFYHLVVWYSHLFKNFSQSVVIHTVKGFDVVNKADVFLELSHFLDDAADGGNLISAFSSAFSKSAWTSWSSWFTYCWSLTWRILSITLIVCEMSAIVQ